MPVRLEAIDTHWVTKRVEEKLIPFLNLINRNCSPNIKQYGWAAGGEKSIADVALLTWIATVIYNPFEEIYTDA